MSTTLNLADRLLAMARTHRDLGRSHDAIELFRRVSRLGAIAPEVAEEAQASLADLAMQSGRFVKARRHLRAALANSPENPSYHHRIGNAIENDERGDLQAAADHYRTSLELDPNQPAVASDLGSLCLRLGQTEEGLAHLRRAVELAPDEPTFLGRLVDGLRDLDQVDEALAALRAARFRHRRDARFEKLYRDFRFGLLSDRQASQAETVNATALEGNQPRSILPFVRPEGWTRPQVRRDAGSPQQPPHRHEPSRVPGRHVQ